MRSKDEMNGAPNGYADGVNLLRFVVGCSLSLALGTGNAVWSQGSPDVDAAAIVRRAVAHRAGEARTHPLLRYVLRKKDGRRETIKEIVETLDGDVARLVAIDGHSLHAEQERAEMARLDNLAAHPELQERRHRSEVEDTKRVSDLLKLLPDAMLYQVEGTVECGSGECYRLSFTPKPGWSSPTLEADVLRGVAGEIWIDQQQETLVRLDARFIADVNFGLGILAKLNRGSTARLEQTDVGMAWGQHDWELTSLTLHITGKALVFKTLEVVTTEQATEFARVPPGLRYRDAIRMLESEHAAK